MNILKKHYVKFAHFLGIYILLLGAFSIFTAGLSLPHYMLDVRRFIPIALAVTIALHSWYKAGLNTIQLLPNIIVSAAWFIVYPFCYWTTYHNSNLGIFGIQFPYDAAFGSYLFVASVFFRLLLLKYTSNKLQSYILGLVHGILFLPPLTQAIYYCIYHSPITSTAALAILQTNPREAQEYIMQIFGYTGVAASCLLVLFMFYCFIRLNSISHYNKENCLQSLKAVGFAFAVTIGLFHYCYTLADSTGLGEAFKFAHEHLESAKLFNKNHDKLLAELKVTPNKPAFGKPSTIVMVIGESAIRDYMSAYTNTKNDTTPWLREQKNSPNFLLFKNTYSPCGNTVMALERVLTEKNQYNKKEFNDSLTIIDLAKAAGYKTYWFSGQGAVSDCDTPITIVANTCDEAYWLEDQAFQFNRQFYDTDLIPLLKQVDPHKNNFVVLHLMGSHDNFFNRYPEEFDKFANHDHNDRVKTYENTIAYTDLVLQQVFEYASQNLNLQAMVYFSDHGNIPDGKRHPDETGFKAMRIPFFAYVSDEYRNLYPEIYKIMQDRQSTYFSSDLMYETMGSLLQIRTNKVDATNSLFDKSFKYKREDLTTALGQRKLIDDKYGE